MTYIETSPSENLKELIHSFWKFEISEQYHNGQSFIFEVMPENKISIVFVHLPHHQAITCLGIQSKRMKRLIYPGSVFVGIRFNPWVSIEKLFGEKSSSINQIIELPAKFSSLFNELPLHYISFGFSNYKLLEQSMLRLSELLKADTDPYVKYICLQLELGKKINDFIKDIPMSIRPIQKRFKKITGITMSEYRNIDRLRKTVEMIYLQQENITTAAFENGYTDHSHFLNTFKNYMMGSTVKNFLSQT